MISEDPPPSSIAQLKYEAEIEKAKEILARYRDRVVMPESVAVREDNHRVEYPVEKIPEDAPVLDLGMDAIAHLVQTLKKAGTVVFNGPAGVFEDADFATGTYELLKAASNVEFSVVGGGHTAAVIEKLGIEKDFTHISTGGGACIEFLTGKKLPAIDALEQSKKIFRIILQSFFSIALMHEAGYGIVVPLPGHNSTVFPGPA